MLKLNIMKTKRKKRGQFYIVSAIIIATVILGISGIVTYSIIKSEPKNIVDLGSDLQEETPRIIDYGIYSDSNITSLVENFTDKDFANYFSTRTGESNVTFIYGDQNSEIKAIRYVKRNKGSTTVGASEWTNTNLERVPVELYVKQDETNPDETDVTILDQKYKFKLKKGERFYFVLSHNKDGETYNKNKK
jgi:hypothetical protein